MVMAISHFEAMNKVESEFKKYKVKTVSDVERDYLESIAELEESVKKK